MSIAVNIIILMAIFLGFRFMYEVVKYTQGDKIKAYYQRQKDLAEGDKILKAQAEKRKLLAFKNSEILEVAVEDMGARGAVWEIGYKPNRDGKLEHYILDITPSESLAVQEF